MCAKRLLSLGGADIYVCGNQALKIIGLQPLRAVLAQICRAKALASFRIASPLREKETPGEAPGVEVWGISSRI